MYVIKHLPEDFIVKEISNISSEGNGQYAYYILKKRQHTTIEALQLLSKKFGIPLKNIGFAGNKDKNAISEQRISIFRGTKNFENIKSNNIELKYIANGTEPISLGELIGNEFTIIIRNLESDEIKTIQNINYKTTKIPNHFGPQRFSKNNLFVGKAILKGDFKKAIELLLENNGISEGRIREYLKKNRNNYIEALRIIPLRTRKLFVHSYQSFLFNEITNRYLAKNEKTKNIQIPIIGFGLEIEKIKNRQLNQIIRKVLEEENINIRDFITNQIPELASEGGFRDLFFDLRNLEILEIGDDELNKNKKKAKINFALPRGCYATVALKFILG